MALKNRVNIGTYEYDGDEIKLQANFAALERLSEAVGIDPLVFIQTMQGPRDIAKLFYHLQFGTSYSEAEIYDAFFAEIGAFEIVENMAKLETLIATLLGAKQHKVLDALDDGKDAQKK